MTSARAWFLVSGTPESRRSPRMPMRIEKKASNDASALGIPPAPTASDRKLAGSASAAIQYAAAIDSPSAAQTRSRRKLACDSELAQRRRELVGEARGEAGGLVMVHERRNEVLARVFLPIGRVGEHGLEALLPGLEHARGQLLRPRQAAELGHHEVDTLLARRRKIGEPAGQAFLGEH